jgi:hypothetical protein
VTQLLLAILVGGVTSYAAISLIPMVLPASTVSKPYVRGLLLALFGLGAGYGLSKLGYEKAGIAAGAVLGGAGVVTIASQAMASLQNQSGASNAPAAGQPAALGSVYYPTMGAVELNALAGNDADEYTRGTELGIVRDLGAIEAQIGDVVDFNGDHIDDYLYTGINTY